MILNTISLFPFKQDNKLWCHSTAGIFSVKLACLNSNVNSVNLVASSMNSILKFV